MPMLFGKDHIKFLIFITILFVVCQSLGSLMLSCTTLVENSKMVQAIHWGYFVVLRLPILVWSYLEARRLYTDKYVPFVWAVLCFFMWHYGIIFLYAKVFYEKLCKIADKLETENPGSGE